MTEATSNGVARTVAELTAQLVAAGWPKGEPNSVGRIDLNSRPSRDHGIWVVGPSGHDGLDVISVHLPESWCLLDAAVSVHFDEQGQLGSVMLWLHEVETEDGGLQEVEDLAWLHTWPGLVVIRSLVEVLV